MICTQDNNKQYIIPTKKWLKPLEKLITYYINIEGLTTITNFIDKEKVIVKITKGKKANIIIEANKIVKNIPNFIQTYCSFTCLENYELLFDSRIETNLIDIVNQNQLGAEDNNIISIEIMKKYKNGSLFKFQNKLNKDQVVNILQQLTLAQIHAYSNVGFIHNDLHLGNILIHKLKKPTHIIYEFSTDSHIKTEINVLSNFIIPLISDFNEAFIYKKDNNFTLEEFNKQFTLCKNINKTFNQCLLLLNEQDYIQIMKLIREKTYEINRYLSTSAKNLRSYYKKYYNYEESKKRECSTAIAFSSFLISILDEKATDYWFGL